MDKESKKTRVTEEATHMGFCYICGQLIYVGDVIVRSTLGLTPVAAHAMCEPGFEVGGQATANKAFPKVGWWTRSAEEVKCLRCGSSNIEIPTVDIGAGEQQCGPIVCNDCHWTEGENIK